VNLPNQTRGDCLRPWQIPGCLFDLFEYESTPAKQKLCKHRAYIAAGYQGTHIFCTMKTTEKPFQNSAKISECSSNKNRLNAAEYKLQIRVCSSSIHNT